MEIGQMTSKKILIAAAFLLSATSVTLAQGGRHYYGAPYGGPSAYGNFGDYYAPSYGNGGYGGGYYDYAPGYAGYPDSQYDAYPGRAAVSQPSPHGGVESQR
jgi:hypothetical protein